MDLNILVPTLITVSNVISWSTIYIFAGQTKGEMRKYFAWSLAINCVIWTVSFEKHVLLVGILFILNAWLYFLFIFLKREDFPIYHRSKHIFPYIYKTWKLWRYKVSLIDTASVIFMLLASALGFYFFIFLYQILSFRGK